MSQTKNEIQIKVARIVTEQLKLNSDVDWNRTFEELGADSLDLIELVIKFEDAFRVMISDEAAARLCRLNDVVDCLQTGALQF